MNGPFLTTSLRKPDPLCGFASRGKRFSVLHTKMDGDLPGVEA